MPLALRIALRYFVSLRRQGVIGWLSLISILGVGVSSAALVIVFSAFNGLEDLIRSVYRQFDPAISIQPARGKFFDADSAALARLRAIQGVAHVVQVLEDHALLRTDEGQLVVRVKGVSGDFLKENRLGHALTLGRFKVEPEEGGLPGLVVGAGVRASLQVPVGNAYHTVQLWYPKSRKGMSLDPRQAFNRRTYRATGMFALEKQYDEKYVFASLAEAQALTAHPGKVSALELALGPGADEDAVAEQAAKALGPGFKVLPYEEQHASLVRVMRLERLLTALVLGIVLVIASINLFTALSMLVLRKQRDLGLLKSLGAAPGTVGRVFYLLGMLISGLGAAVGLVLGTGLVWLQQEYGLVSMGLANAIVSDYPVSLRWADLGITLAAILVLGLLVSFFPAGRAERIRLTFAE